MSDIMRNELSYRIYIDCLFDCIIMRFIKGCSSKYVFEKWVFKNVFREPSRKSISEKFSIFFLRGSHTEYILIVWLYYYGVYKRLFFEICLYKMGFLKMFFENLRGKVLDILLNLIIHTLLSWIIILSIVEFTYIKHIFWYKYIMRNEWHNEKWVT